jgi:Phasin protein
MSTETIEQWGKFSRAALDSLKELTAINAKLVERLSEQQLELVGLTLEASIKGANLAVGVPAYKEFVSGQTALAGEYNEKVLSIVRKTGGIVAEARDQYSEWTEGRLKEIATPITRVAARKSA